MKHAATNKAAAKNPRKRRALAVLSEANRNSIPAASIRLVAFRAPTAAERARGKAFSGRAAELLARKGCKVAAAR
jgi:hypothetical protein